jgi:hypothetical protein
MAKAGPSPGCLSPGRGRGILITDRVSRSRSTPVASAVVPRTYSERGPDTASCGATDIYIAMNKLGVSIPFHRPPHPPASCLRLSTSRRRAPRELT